MKQEGQNLVAYILNNRNNDNPLLYFSSNGNYGVSKLFPLNLVDGGTKTYAKSIWELKDLEMLQDMSKNNCVIGNKIYIK
ncbi:MAG: hypothetical protein LBG59_09005 [Candidatus Peribacteria bacterium]|jgi:hypothetical protein|nr:hypothetical protein [Candidatus Peribacteria bacterium]